MQDSNDLLDVAGLAARKGFRTEWLWHDYLGRGMITLLTSRWKTGKTTLLSLLLERIGSGLPLAGSPVRLDKAIVITEESAEIWHARAQSLGLGANVRWICRPYRFRPTLKEFAHLFDAACGEPNAFVAVDTLAHFLPEDRENSADRLLEAIGPMRRLTADGQCVLLLHHPKKSAGPDLTPRGSEALTAFADIIVNLERPRHAVLTDRRRIFRSWSRLGGVSERIFELAPDGRDYLPVIETLREDSFEAGWNVLRTVLEDLGDGLSRRDILAAWPEDYDAPSKVTLHRWLTQALDLGRITRSGTGRCDEPFRYGLAAAGDEELIQP